MSPHPRFSRTTRRPVPWAWTTMVLVPVMLLGSLSGRAEAQSSAITSTVHAFNGSDGKAPQAGLVRGRDGRLYGTTIYGGPSDAGTVFALDPATGSWTTLFAFSGSDGANPTGRLLQGRDDRLYGTTAAGGAGNYGTVFALDAAGTLTTLHAFGGSDGAYPQAGLLETSDGTLYGTVMLGGPSNAGTLFSLDTAGILTTIFPFDYTHGAYPRGDLVRGRDGRIYGTAWYGGPSDGGIVFALDAAGTVTTVHAFGGSDGSAPYSGLIQAPDGTFYGTTREGGAHGLGTVFAQAESGVLTTLRHFSGSDGANPEAPLTLAIDGQLYGTTSAGGAAGFGTVFTLDGVGTLTTLHTFHYADGRTPRGGLLQVGDGIFYGTTEAGGPANAGVVFRLTLVGTPRRPVVVWPTPAAVAAGTPLGTSQLNATASVPGTFTYTPASGTVLAAGANQILSVTFVPADPAVYVSVTAYVTIAVVTPPPGIGVPEFAAVGAFSGSDGRSPQVGLVEGRDGRLYGTTMYGGQSNYGTVFAVDPASGTRTTLFSFSGSDGANPAGRLLQGRDDRLYGTTTYGGPSNYGTVFALDAAGTLTTLHAFSGSDGRTPRAGLIETSDGSLYGTTMNGGPKGNGTIFIVGAAGTLTTIAPFDYHSTSGAYPRGDLLQGRDGRIYGTTSSGGPSGGGTVFALDASGTLTALHAFGGSDGSSPYAGIIQAPDGTFYGTTREGGGNSLGTIFALNGASVLTTLRQFSGNDGANPEAPLTLALDDQLYGTTAVGGSAGFGTVFSVDGAGALTTLHTFHYTDGRTPRGGVVQASDGAFYGTTEAGGPANAGVVFRLTRVDTPQRPVIVWPAPAGIAARTPLGASQLNATASVPGTLTYTPASGTVLAVGANQVLSVMFVPADSATYASVEAHVTIAVLAPPPGTATPEFASVLGSSGSDGQRLEAALVQGRDGRLYGTTMYGGPGNAGTVFAVDPATRTRTTLFAFSGSDGANPTGRLLQGRDDRIYGTTTSGGPNNSGIVFALDAAGTLTTLHAFSGSDGAYPQAGLLETSDGTLYGTTMLGGPNGNGTIFTVDAAGTLTTIFPFGVSSTTGAYPRGDLVQGRDGRIYGTTWYGGPWDSGTVFALNASGTQTRLHAFGESDGSSPYAGLIQAPDGTFYGTTREGGASHLGTVFRLDGAGVLTTLHHFGGNDGANPEAPLTRALDGHLYGTTAAGGAAGFGTVFTLDGAGALTTMFAFSGSDGRYPAAGLLQASDGALFGTTRSGGPLDAGVVFKTKAIPVLTWGAPASIVFGTALNATQLNATASVPGTFAYTPGSGTILNSGMGQTLSVTFTPVDTANYTVVTTTVTMDVTKATPVVTWASPAAITAGTALSAMQLNATANVAGTFVYAPAAGTVLNLGVGQTLSVTFTPTDATNYTSATKTVSIDVLPSGGPVVTDVAPGSGAIGSGVTVTGTGFTGTTAVTFHWVTAAYAVVSDTQLTTTVPAGTTTGPVRVTTPVGTATSATDFVVTNQRATRTLAGCYVAGYGVPVSIDVGPAPAVFVQAAADTPPAGWTIGTISDGGTWDAPTSQVTWGPFFDATARVLTYVVTPPAETTETVTFAGVARFDGVEVPIGGTTVLARCEQHPADANSDFRMVIGEVTGYGAAWKKGSTWTVPPVPIPIGYMTRAGYLWRAGETYRRDAGACPACWVSLTAVPLPVPDALLPLEDIPMPSGGPWSPGSTDPVVSDRVRSPGASLRLASARGARSLRPFDELRVAPSDVEGRLRSGPAGQAAPGAPAPISPVRRIRIGTAVRHALAPYVPTVPMTVSLTVTPDGDVQTWALEETVPAGWQVSQVSADGYWDEKAGVVRWGPFFDETPQTLRYTLTPPAGTSGPQDLRGTASFDGEDVAVAGVRTLQRAPIARPGEPGT